MKTKIFMLFAALMLASGSQLMAQSKVTVQAESDDISANLDLKAVASVFGESDNLQDFERRLNDYDSKISNLDLNNDGEVDYLRVIDKYENNVHVVVIQAVLGKDVYQDVATIVVEKFRTNRTYVQVIGDPYIYGDDYIVEPVYVVAPPIFTWFWSPFYSPWYSPYYWGYYPGYYHPWHPFGIGLYCSNIYGRIDHRHSYYYTEHYRSPYARNIYRSMERNDYAVRHPESSFSRRNAGTNLRNSYDIQSRGAAAQRSGGRADNLINRDNYQGRGASVSSDRGGSRSNGYNSTGREVQSNSGRTGSARDDVYNGTGRNSSGNSYTPSRSNNNSYSPGRSGGSYESRGNQSSSGRSSYSPGSSSSPSRSSSVSSQPSGGRSGGGSAPSRSSSSGNSGGGGGGRSSGGGGGRR